MSTRSFIGIENDDGSIDAIYCHWDGHPDTAKGVGQILRNHYQSREKVAELISGGSLSYLEAEISPPAGASHSFASPADGVCVFYGRDRGESRGTTEPTKHRGRPALVSMARSLCAKYVYVLTKSGWRYRDVRRGRFLPIPNPERVKQP